MDKEFIKIDFGDGEFQLVNKWDIVRFEKRDQQDCFIHIRGENPRKIATSWDDVNQALEAAGILIDFEL